MYYQYRYCNEFEDFSYRIALNTTKSGSLLRLNAINLFEKVVCVTR